MPGRDSKRQGNYQTYGYGNGRGGGAPRNHVIPSEPPFTAYIGNAPESMVQGDFETHLFVGLKIKQVRLVRDRQTDRFRGFAYVDFDDADSLRRAIELDGTPINDRPIRIDVAVRPLGAGKPEGFRNKPGFESNTARRHPSGNTNNGSRQDGYHYQQQDTYQYVADGHQNEHHSERNRRPSGAGKTNERRNSQSQQQHKTPVHQVSNDDVFIAPDTPTSTDEGAEQASSTMTRQQSRNWADCPIDESVTEASPPTSANNTLAGDDFQVVRNKNTKPRGNQQASSRPMSGTQSLRGRNNGNYPRGGSGQMSDGRGFYDQFSSQYSNQSQQFYRQQQGPPPPHHMGLSYHVNHNNNNNPHHRPPPPPRQRVDSNRSNNSRTYPDKNDGFKKGHSETSTDLDNAAVPAENRPRLQLLPRSQKLSSSTDDAQTPEPASRNANIFGSGKPRDERDPKVAELTKHIEEVLGKEPQAPGTTPSASGELTDGVTKPVRILAAATGS